MGRENKNTRTAVGSAGEVGRADHRSAADIYWRGCALGEGCGGGGVASWGTAPRFENEAWSESGGGDGGAGDVDGHGHGRGGAGSERLCSRRGVAEKGLPWSECACTSGNAIGGGGIDGACGWAQADVVIEFRDAGEFDQFL